MVVSQMLSATYLRRCVILMVEAALLPSLPGTNMQLGSRGRLVDTAYQAYFRIIRVPSKLATQLTSIITDRLGTQTFDQVDQMFVYLDYFEVSQFLRRESFLVPILLEAYSELEQRFIHFRYHLALDVLREDSVDDGLLYILVRTTDNFDDIQPILDKLDEEWWLGEVEKARGKLVIDVEYI